MLAVSVLTTSCLVACMTIPVLSKTPFGGNVVSYSMNSALAIEPEAQSPTLIEALEELLLTSDSVKDAVFAEGTVYILVSVFALVMSV